MNDFDRYFSSPMCKDFRHRLVSQDWLLTELEQGFRVAYMQDNEDSGFGALFDLSYDLYCKENNG